MVLNSFSYVFILSIIVYLDAQIINKFLPFQPADYSVVPCSKCTTMFQNVLDSVLISKKWVTNLSLGVKDHWRSRTFLVGHCGVVDWSPYIQHHVKRNT